MRVRTLRLGIERRTTSHGIFAERPRPEITSLVVVAAFAAVHWQANELQRLPLLVALELQVGVLPRRHRTDPHVLRHCQTIERVVSSLNATIVALDVVEKVSRITSAKAAFSVVDGILTMVSHRVRFTHF